MSLLAAMKTAFEADDDLMDLLTGGVFIHVSEVSRQNTPGAFDANKEIIPCVLIKEGNEVPDGPYSRSARTPLRVYFYQPRGFDVIEQAMDIIFDLLHEQRIGENTWQILYTGRLLDSRLGDIRDIALDCSMGLENFVAVRMK